MTTVRELARLHRAVGQRHRCCHRKIASDLGLYYGQPIMLMILYDHETMSQAELARLLNNTPASVAVSVKRMEKAGLITKSPDPQDMRCNVIRLTETGRELATRCRVAWDRADDELYVGFSEEERDLLSRLYRRMMDNLARLDARLKG